jgi:hypothetical protein
MLIDAVDVLERKPRMHYRKPSLNFRRRLGSAPVIENHRR